jgi:Tfp pilus assembly protein PilX
MARDSEATAVKRAFSKATALLGRQDGVAMLTVLMLTIILTVIGIAAITTTSLDIRMAGGERLRESSVNAAEACMSSGVQLIQQTLASAAIPAALLTAGNNPSVTQNPLQAEIMGQSDENPDNADPNAGVAAPNAVLTLTPFTVNMDIDRLYAKAKAGGSLQFAAGYEGTAGGAAGGGIEIFYRIDCYARNTTGTTQVFGKVTGVYACVATGETCQRKI